MANGHIAIVGAGVVGLTTGIELSHRGWLVTIYADEIPGRTSLAAGASWGPYHAQPYDRVATWGQETYRRLAALATTAESGVAMVNGLEASRTAAQPPAWTAALPNVTACEPGELPDGFTCGWRYTVPVVDMPSYLQFLLRQFQSAGGKLTERHVNSFGELANEASVIVNCSGLGAAHLAGDAEVYPIRGQLVIVENPGLTEFFSEDTGSSTNLCHFLPTGDTVVLGGVAVPFDDRLNPDPATAEAIVVRCSAIEPRLRGARVVGHRVGLRPTRPAVRLDVEHSGDFQVVHNYGHGGAGVSLSWGCAAEIRSILDIAG